MKKLLFLLALLFPASAVAQTTTAGFNGYCTLGAAFARTSGLPSSNYLQGIIPQCTVTVYLTGTLTRATIYSNAGSGSLTNPFTANVSGSWLFFAAEGQGYDVVMSGGFPPNNYITPVTLTDLLVGGGGGGSGVTVCAPVNAIQIANVGATNLTCDPEITENTATHSIYVGGLISGYSVNIGARSVMPASWDLDTTTGLTAIDSMTGAGTPSYAWKWNGTTGQWLPENIAVVQVNSTPLTSQSPVNFTDSSSVTFSNPSAGVITATAIAPGVTFQHNGTNLALQTLINYNDTTPVAAGGFANALFQSDSSGRLSVEYQLASSQIQQLVNIPSIGGLQSALVYFRATTNSGIGTGGNFAYSYADPTGQTPSSGYVAHGGCGSWNPGGVCVSEVNATYSNAVLPSYISPSSVSQVWPVAVVSSGGPYGKGYVATSSLGCTNPSGGGAPDLLGASGEIPFPPQQFQLQDVGVTGAQVSSIVCNLNVTSLDSVQTANNAYASKIALIVYYTGSAPPLTNSINVAPPLSYQPVGNVIGLTTPYNYAADLGSVNAISLNQYFYDTGGNPRQAQPGDEIDFVPAYSNTSATPTLTYYGNTVGPATIIKANLSPLAAGDILSLSGQCCIAKVIYDSNLNWELQNPQTGTGEAYAGVTTDGSQGLRVVGAVNSQSSLQVAVSPVTSSALYAGAVVPLTVTQQATSGGRDSTLEESRFFSINATETTNTLGTSWAINTTQHCYSPSDCLPYLSGTDSIGISPVQGEGMDVHISMAEQGAVSGGTLSSIACSTICTLAIAQGYGTSHAWGDSVPIADLTNAYNIGAVTNITGPAVTGNGTTNWDAHFGTTYAEATTTAAVNNPGSVNIFPRTNVTINIGAVTGTGFTTGSTPACAFDNTDTSWQCFHITTIGSGTITADYMGWPLTSGSIIAQGGLTGYGFSMDLDTVSPGNLHGYSNASDQAVTGTIRQVRPIVSNTSGDILTVYTNTSGEAQFNTVAGSGSIISGAGLYHIIPQVRALSVKSTTSGLVDGSGITTTPVIGTFSIADTVEQPHYFAAKAQGLNLMQNNWQSMPGWGRGFTFNMSGTMAVQGYGGEIINNNSPTLYTGLPSSISMVTTPGYGNLLTPNGIEIAGPFANGIWKNYPSFGEAYRMGLIHQDCATWCAINQNIEIGSWQNNTGTYGEDAILYNPDTYTTTITAGSTGAAGSAAPCSIVFAPVGVSQTGSGCVSQISTHLSGVTGTITGTSLAASCNSGTVTVTGAVVGQPVLVSSTTGVDVGGAFNLRASVTSTNTVTVYVCGTGTPASLAYNVMVE